MRKTILTLAIVALTFTVTSCKDAKKENNKEEEPQTEMKTEDHSSMNHDNSDGHHDGNAKTKEHDNSDGHHDNDASASHHERDIDANTQKNAATTPIIDAYIQIKNGLVADSNTDAAKGGTALVAAFTKFDMTALTKFDMTALKGDTHKEYMEIMESAKEHAEHIVKSDIAHQREHFEVLSTDVNDLITLLGTEKTLYQDFCPMANNNKGAYWLSEIKDIKNPYFGAKMMKCGSVKKQIN